MYQMNPLTPVIETVRLAPANATPVQRRKLAKYIKQHMFIRRVAASRRNGNQVVKGIADEFIDNGYRIPEINQPELAKALDRIGL